MCTILSLHVNLFSQLSGGGDDGAHLKSGMADGLFQCAVETKGVPCNQTDAAQNDCKIQAQFFVSENVFPLLDENQVIAAEVDTKQNHKYGSDILDIGGVAGQRVVFNAKTAGTCGAEGSTDSLEQSHAADQQKNDVENGHDHIDDVEDGCG